MQESTKRRILIGLIIASLLPAIALPQVPTFVSASSISLYLSAIFGYIGVVLLLWMYIIGAKSLFGLWFTDLAPVLNIHKWIGKYGTLAIFIHPVLITISYGASWLYSFIPALSTWTERHILLGQIAFWVLLLIWIVSALVRDKISWRVWRYLHALAYLCVPFVLLHIPDLGSQQRAHPFVNAYFMMLVAVFALISLIRLLSVVNLDRTKYRVVRHIPLTPIDYMIKLEPVSSRRLAPRFGQYLYIKLGLMSEDHPFSVTQYDDASGAITLTYRLAGMYTQEMAKLATGDEVFLSGPYGTFLSDVADSSLPTVYLAGGIGVTPFVGPIMNDGDRQWLFSANRTRELAVLSKPLKDALGSRAISIYSRESGDPQPQEEMGYITADMLRKYLGNLDEYRYYLCGPPAMMQSMRDMLTAAGVGHTQVHSEEFGW
jgi:predicted ferric reductase